MKPPTLEEATGRGLIVKDGICTFSNGTAWDCWADGNCYECRHYDIDGTAGEMCAFEGAALLGMVSPDLARMFGWTEDAEYPGEFDEPETCRFFRQRRDENDDTPEPPEDSPDPAQLVLLADPTEDAMHIVNAPVPVAALAAMEATRAE